MLVACAHRPGAAPSQAEVRAHHYQDSSGLLVGTYGGWVQQRLGRVRAEGKVVADYVRLDPDRGYDPSDPTADRSAPDAITSATATVGNGSVAEEWRIEGQAGLQVDGTVGTAPASVGAFARASHETDYRSVSGALRADAELFDRNMGLSAQVAYGRDNVRPVETLRGQEALWPASHDRWSVMVSATQLISPRLVAGAGVTATWQRGALSSPYRRAVVRPNLLLPEALPRERDRYTAFLSLSASLTPATALHVRQGAYADSWSVKALIPEVAVATEVAPEVLLQLGYRHYRQSRASFYRTEYLEPAPVMAGDVRLGGISDHTVALELRRILRAGLALSFGYDISSLLYRDVQARVVAHVFHLGLGAEY